MRPYDQTEGDLFMFLVLFLFVAVGCAGAWVVEQWETRQRDKRYLKRIEDHEEHG